MPNSNKDKNEKNKNPVKTEIRDNGTLICTYKEYVFNIARRDFSFPHLPEIPPHGDNPYQRNTVGRVDFVFPEWECKPANPLELKELASGRVFEALELETKRIDAIDDIDYYRGFNFSVETLVVEAKPDFIYTGRELFKPSLITDSTALNIELLQNGRTAFLDTVVIPPILPEDLRHLVSYQGRFASVENLNFSQHRIQLDNVVFNQGRNLHDRINLRERQTSILYPEQIGSISSYISCSFIDTPETIFDFYSPCCKGDSLWYGDDPRLYHEMGRKLFPNSEVHIHGSNRALIVDDLTTQTNLVNIWMLRGTEYWLNQTDESIPLYNINNSMGRFMQVAFDWNRTSNFCEIPQEWTGDELVIEMAEIIDESCHREYIRQGRSLLLNTMFTGFSFDIDTYQGRCLDTYIDVDRWEARIYTGRMLLPHVALDHIYDNTALATGRLLQTSLFDVPELLYFGREMSVEISTRYYVEFTEYGCLDNEHIYTDEHGYRQDYLTITAPVEFLPYDHFIKARCF